MWKPVTTAFWILCDWSSNFPGKLKKNYLLLKKGFDDLGHVTMLSDRGVQSNALKRTQTTHWLGHQSGSWHQAESVQTRNLFPAVATHSTALTADASHSTGFHSTHTHTHTNTDVGQQSAYPVDWNHIFVPCRPPAFSVLRVLLLDLSVCKANIMSSWYVVI